MCQTQEKTDTTTIFGNQLIFLPRMCQEIFLERYTFLKKNNTYLHLYIHIYKYIYDFIQLSFDNTDIVGSLNCLGRNSACLAAVASGIRFVQKIRPKNQSPAVHKRINVPRGEFCFGFGFPVVIRSRSLVFRHRKFDGVLGDPTKHLGIDIYVTCRSVFRTIPMQIYFKMNTSRYGYTGGEFQGKHMQFQRGAVYAAEYGLCHEFTISRPTIEINERGWILSGCSQILCFINIRKIIGIIIKTKI